MSNLNSLKKAELIAMVENQNSIIQEMVVGASQTEEEFMARILELEAKLAAALEVPDEGDLLDGLCERLGISERTNALWDNLSVKSVSRGNFSLSFPVDFYRGREGECRAFLGALYKRAETRGVWRRFQGGCLLIGRAL